MRCFFGLLLSLSLPLLARPQSHTVRIGVLGIFHPHQLTLAADQTSELLVSVAGQQIFLQPRSSCSLLRVQSSGESMVLGCGGKEMRADEIRVTGRNQEFAGLVITIPGKMKRRYQGMLELKAKNGELIPIVTMDLETAVASVVQAETVPGSPVEALKAQAVVSRSYLVAGEGRHADFDFCDLTHCQFLREPPATDGPAASAAAATHGLVLTYDEKPVAAMFTRSCGGHTRTAREIGLPQARYPYFSVTCEFCYQNPVRWTRKVSPEDAARLLLHGENGRLDIGRRLGWDAVPSNNFTAREQDREVTLQGVGQGHGLGLCQRGARNMAERESGFRVILDHYFPNTRVEEIPSPP
jgi:peptidoglycan hydrolase-like amidase